MVPLTSLLIPIVVSAVLVFVASSIIHMFTPIHRNDVRRLPKEDEVMNALRPFNIPPGDYAMPHAGSHANVKNPEFLSKVSKGPVMFMTVMTNGMPSMGQSMALWFLYCLVVSLVAGYIASRAVGPDAEYLEVFRFAGTTAFASYSLGLFQNSIWWHRNWGTTLRGVLDGLIFGLLTAGTFGWLWPEP
jgi:hypothetical protein